MTEPDITPEEELEAAALRAALDEGRSGEHLPGDALEAASLLRFSGSEGELSDGRQAELRAELMASLPARAARRERPRIMIWLAALGGVGALAALLSTPQRPATDPQSSLAESATAGALARAPAAGAELALSDPGADDDLAAARAAPDDEDDDAIARTYSRPLAETSAAPPAVVARNEAAARAERRSARMGASGAGKPEGATAGALALGEAASGGAPAPAAAFTAPAPAATHGTTRAALERARLKARRELEARVAVRTAPGEAAKGRAPSAGREALLAELEATQASSIDPGDRRPLQQDLYWRLAEQALRQGRPEQALDWARQGIALDGPPSPFLGLLWQAQGEAQEALGQREAAARSYLEAQSISAALLREDLEQ